MPGASLLTLLDDIASLLDDVSAMTKVAVQKTAGVLGDDLALNAQQVAGVHASRELPVVWAVAVGSAKNKAILLPAAVGLSAFAPFLVSPLLMVGGAFLCFEGVEKLAHKLMHRDHVEDASAAAQRAADADLAADPASLERDKIKGAVRTDFVLSAEIITIALGTVAEASLAERIAVLVGISVVMTLGVYGLVAAIVKLDDLGLYLRRSRYGLVEVLGRFLLAFAPWLMKALALGGTLAMFLVGGGILVHGIPQLHHASEAVAARAGVLAGLVPSGLAMVAGVSVGALVLMLVSLAKRGRGRTH